MPDQTTFSPTPEFSLEKCLLAALALAFTLAFFHTHGSSDVDRFWLSWIQILAEEDNFREGFAAIHADYPPLSILMLYGMHHLASASGIDVFLLLKGSMLVFLLSTTLVYYRLSRDSTTTLLLHFLFLPGSMMLTYLDIYYAPFLILSLWALHRQQTALAGWLFVACCTIKYQPLIVAPFFAIYIWKLHRLKNLHALHDTIEALGVPALLACALMVLLAGETFFVSFYNALFHSRPSFQALNPWWIYQQVVAPWISWDIRYIIYGSRVLFAACYLFLLAHFMRHGSTFADFLLYTLAGFCCYFVLVSGVHENHLFVAAVIASMLYLVCPRYRAMALFVLLMNNINLLLFNGLDGKGLSFTTVFVVDMATAIAYINSAFFLCLLYRLVQQPGGRPL